MIIMRKICKIKFSKTEETRNLEAAMLKLQKCYCPRRVLAQRPKPEEAP